MTQTSGTPESFEAAITELEQLVRNMETGEISLEQALESYQRGVGLLRYCRNTLSEAEQRIRRLEDEISAEASGSGAGAAQS